MPSPDWKAVRTRASRRPNRPTSARLEQGGKPRRAPSDRGGGRRIAMKADSIVNLTAAVPDRSPADGPAPGTAAKRGLSLRLASRVADALFGYDVFISYAWDDGGGYPTALAKRLRAERFRVFLDREGYIAGDHLPQATRRRVGMSRMLLIVFRPKVVDSKWVLREVEVC